MKTTLAPKTFTVLLFSLLALIGSEAPAFAQGTAFTYQGRLHDNGTPANGNYDLTFAVFDADSAGLQVGATLTNSAAGVSNGLFTVALNFGAGVFTGPARWLEIGVKSNGVAGAHTLLTPRQQLAPSPYAIFAGGAQTANTVATGGVSAASLAVGAVNSDAIADGSIQPDDISTPLLNSTFWRLNGNTGTTPGASFLGTSDNQPLELNVNGIRALRIEPTIRDAPNLIGGAAGNLVPVGIVGATIGGGGALNFFGASFTNRIAADFGVIGGGLGNDIQSLARSSTIGGGEINGIQTNASRGVIGGGRGNIIQSGAVYSTIGGGRDNTIQSEAPYTTIDGGRNNTVFSNATSSAIGGGFFNQILAGADYATIPGGTSNSVAGEFGFAAGQRAKANHTGAFVWADSQSADFASTSANQFLIRASGGVGIGTNNPAGAMLSVNGLVRATGFNGPVAASNLTGAIAPANIGAGTISSTMLAAGSVTSNQLAAGSVTTSSLADGAVSLSKLSTAQANLSSTPSITFTNPFPVLGDLFGFAVAAVGTDKVLIGVPSDDSGAISAGAAYLFSTSGTRLGTFFDPTPVNFEQFGVAVAAVGTDKVLIGAVQAVNGSFSSGEAYLFSTNGTRLRTFFNPTPADGDRFGNAVTPVGTDKVLIGAPSDNTGAPQAGAAYLFSTNGTLLTTFTNPAPASSTGFGNAVAAVGTDKVLIGVPFDDTGASDAGAAYLFSTNGTLLTTFTNPAPANIEQFGNAVAAVGTDKVLIAAHQDSLSAPQAGAAYLFSTNGTLLTTFTNPAPASSDQFGSSVAAVGADKVLIAASGDDTGASGAGAAYLFSTNGTLLTTFNNPAPVANDQFGFSVAAVGTDNVLIGTPRDDTGASDAGAAYLFSLSNPYVPGLLSEGVVDHSITAADLDFSIGLWSRSGANLYYNDGNVGIGTNGPQQKLHVLGNILASGTVTATNFSGSGAGLINVAVASGSTNYIQNQTVTDQAAGFRINGNGIFNGGRVGIGTTNPALRLTVAGSGAFNSSGAAAILLNNTAANGHDWEWHALDDGRLQLVDFTVGGSGGRLLIDTNGNVGIGTASPTNKLHVAGGVSATAFIGTSDRHAKENFTSVDVRDVLAKVVTLPISKWNFKEMPGRPHMGPTAQDFYAAFSLGGSDTTITTVDPDGVALAAIQGLNQKVEEKDVEIRNLRFRLEKLEQLLARGLNNTERK